MTVHRCKWSVVHGVFTTVHNLFGRVQINIISATDIILSVFQLGQ